MGQFIISVGREYGSGGHEIATILSERFNVPMYDRNMLDQLAEKNGIDAVYYPLASDSDMFNENVPSSEDYRCDYCFTGSYWDAKREIIEYLNP